MTSDDTVTLRAAAAERHGPRCAFCGGNWQDSHQGEWADQGHIACRCGNKSCRIGAALASPSPEPLDAAQWADVLHPIIDEALDGCPEQDLNPLCWHIAEAVAARLRSHE